MIGHAQSIVVSRSTVGKRRRLTGKQTDPAIVVSRSTAGKRRRLTGKQTDPAREAVLAKAYAVECADDGLETLGLNVSKLQ